MAAHALATCDTMSATAFDEGRGTWRKSALADTVPVPRNASSPGAREQKGRGEVLADAATFLREHFLRHKGLLSPRDVVREMAERADRLGAHPQASPQHVYQEALYQSSQARDRASWTASTLKAGWYRLELSVPAQARLLKWQAKQAMSRLGAPTLSFGRGRSRKLVRQLLPMLVVLCASVACGIVSKEGPGQSGLDLAIAPPLSKPSRTGKDGPTRQAPWSYVLPVDHGVRADGSGQGTFRAPRFHGEHNGLDLLAPVGTPVFSPCTGQAMAGVSRSFGRWVHIICPVPDAYMKTGAARPWASFFYAHLDDTALPHNKWTDVTGAQELGAVGKTGNARGPNVQPHLHLELIIQSNRRSAMDERHLGSDQSSVPAAGDFAQALSVECMDPYGFKPKSDLLSRARRIDPFVALTCLSQAKPNFEKPASPLNAASQAWTQFYEAKDFNVNLGVEDSRMAIR